MEPLEDRFREAAVLKEALHLLQDVADGAILADGRGDDGVLDMQIVRDIEAFLASLPSTNGGE